jgi:hypothetical protein
MRFSIRDLLLLTVIVAISTGWAIDRWRLAKRAKELEYRTLVLQMNADMAKTQAAFERNIAQVARIQSQLDDQRYADLAKEAAAAATDK